MYAQTLLCLLMTALLGVIAAVAEGGEQSELTANGQQTAQLLLDQSRPYADIGVNLTAAEARERIRNIDLNQLKDMDFTQFFFKTLSVMTSPLAADSFERVEGRLGYGGCPSGTVRRGPICTLGVLTSPLTNDTFNRVELLGYGRCASGMVRRGPLCVNSG